MSLLRRVIGAVLRRERQRQGLTLREVARAAGVSVPYLSEVERGRKEASSEVLAAVCRALGLYLSDLLEAVRDELRRVERRMPATPLGGAPLGEQLPSTRHGGSVIASTRSASGGARRPVARLGEVGSGTATAAGWFGATGGLPGTTGNELSGTGMPLGGVTPVGGVTGGLRIVVFGDPVGPLLGAESTRFGNQPGRLDVRATSRRPTPVVRGSLRHSTPVVRGPLRHATPVVRGSVRRATPVARASGSALRRARRMRSAVLAARLMRTFSEHATGPGRAFRHGQRPVGHVVPRALPQLSHPSRDFVSH